jgi:hypothetical protein
MPLLTPNFPTPQLSSFPTMLSVVLKLLLRLYTCLWQFFRFSIAHLQSIGDGKWKYVGGDTFLETVPVSWRYTDVIFSLTEKVNGAISVKYQLPGEDLDPDSLISVSDDSDIAELYGEYFRALRQPGTPIRTFRLRLFLFRAAEDPYTPEDIAAEARYMELLPGDDDGKHFLNFSGSLVLAPPGDSEASSVAAEALHTSTTNGGRGGSTRAADALTDFEDEFLADGMHTPSTVAADAELAWEAGFKAGHEAAMLASATEEEWTELLNRRMAHLAHTASEYLLNRGGGVGWEDNDDGNETSPAASLLLPGPGHVGDVGRGEGDGEPLGFGSEGLSVDPDADPEFKTMFESKYEITESTKKAMAARRPQGHHRYPLQLGSPLLQNGGGGGGGGSHQEGTATSAPSSTLQALNLGDASGFDTAPHRIRTAPTSSTAISIGLAPSGPDTTATAATILSPNSMLPAHISIFGDDLGEAAARAVVARYGPPPAAAANLPSHISEFGSSDSSASDGANATTDGDEYEYEYGNEYGHGGDGVYCDDDDEDEMSLPEGIAEAVLPAEDGHAGPAKKKKRSRPGKNRRKRTSHPPDAALLPTRFDLLGGDAAGGLNADNHRHHDARNGGGGGGVPVGAGALPPAPADLPQGLAMEPSLSGVHRVDSSALAVLAKIGEGSFGEVSLCQCPTFGRVAVKWIKSTKVERWASFWREAELMSRLNHPNVLRFYGLVTQGDYVVGIMTEFAASGSLASFMRRKGAVAGQASGFLPLQCRVQLALQAANGMAYLHSQKVVHFDVKPDNLLVDGGWSTPGGPSLKVADFGLSVVKANTFCSNVHDLRGTLPYMAPEMITDHQHVTEAADVWSLGVVFWEMLTLESPYADILPAQLLGALGSGAARLPIPDWCEPEWRAVMEMCWLVDPTARPTCRQLALQLQRIRDNAHSP